MAERGKGRKCADCANWKVKDSHCTYYDSIVKGIIFKTDPACDDFYPKGKEKPKLHKASGHADQGHYEAIYNKEKPVFLVLSKDTFKIYEEVTVEAESFLPKEYPSEFPYEPYGFYEGSVPSREDLFWIVRDEFDLFLDLESIWKDYLAACVLLSYQQEKLRTVPYPYFVGDNESGKSVALSLLNWLCYRPMMGVTIPSADIYGYLEIIADTAFRKTTAESDIRLLFNHDPNWPLGRNRSGTLELDASAMMRAHTSSRTGRLPRAASS